jgi:hypothetical protein
MGDTFGAGDAAPDAGESIYIGEWRSIKRPRNPVSERPGADDHRPVRRPLTSNFTPSAFAAHYSFVVKPSGLFRSCA